MRVLGLIPARGGSKGVPRKNIKELAGRPLLAYTAESALDAKRLTRVVLSTDDEEIAAVGRALGLAVPFLRPAELARDTSPTLPVVFHALDALAAAGEEFDAVCLLQPTNPLRRAADIDACLALLAESGADSVLSVLPVPHEYNPHWVYWRAASGELHLATGESEPIPRRQSLPPAYHREGSVYATRTAALYRDGNLYGRKVLGYEMAAENSVNIDTIEDWKRAETLLKAMTI